jgi:uncharacterized membrane protein YfcA
MDITLLTALILLATGLWAGAVNSVAGGGTFFSFPILLLLGMPPLAANTTNKFALWFASFAGVTGFWREIKAQKSRVWFYFTCGFIGSLLGSLLLLATPAEKFEAMVPWLMLAATLLFAFGKKLVGWVRRHKQADEAPRDKSLLAATGQTLIGIYGGFFAAGMGMLMMALYELVGIKSVHEMNGLKTFVGIAINGISALTFMAFGMVVWPVALCLLTGALVGGYFGAVLSKRMPEIWLRRAIIFYGAAMSVYFFSV